MGTREFEFEPELICDRCGKKGAWDFYGDYYCDECLKPKDKKAAELARLIDLLWYAYDHGSFATTNETAKWYKDVEEVLEVEKGKT